MTDQTLMKPIDAIPSVERLESLSLPDLNDLCDATEVSIRAGGGFGWVDVPERDTLERFWNGVMAMPARSLLVVRLDGVIAGACQLVSPPQNNEAQAMSVHLTTSFVAPWARGHGLATMLVQHAEKIAREDGFAVINLDVRETMESAMKLYEAQGFIRVGMHPYYAKVGDEVLSGYYYYKVINPDVVEAK